MLFISGTNHKKLVFLNLLPIQDFILEIYSSEYIENTF